MRQQKRLANRFPGTCRVCSAEVKAGAGLAVYVDRIRGSRWDVMHRDCITGDGDAIARRRIAAAATHEQCLGRGVCSCQSTGEQVAHEIEQVGQRVGYPAWLNG